MTSASWLGLAVVVFYVAFILWVLARSAKAKPAEELTQDHQPQGERKRETMPAWELPPSFLSSTGKVDADGRPAGMRLVKYPNDKEGKTE